MSARYEWATMTHFLPSPLFSNDTECWRTDLGRFDGTVRSDCHERQEDAIELLRLHGFDIGAMVE